MKKIIHSILLSGSLLTAVAYADNASPLQQDILNDQTQWAHINYELPDNQKEAAFSALATHEAALIHTYPNRAEPLIWHAIILSSLAGTEGGLGALGKVKEARNQLLAAEKIDPTAMNGSIEASLGTLYYKVPGWPLSFGDDGKAEAYLKKALQINPNGIDPNYFYADFLYGKHNYGAAMQALQKALAAPPRPDRPLADQGRRKEVLALMEKIRTNHPDAIASLGH
ncbi:MAG: hypothetical protein B7Y07_03240 [Halothiobacillus sp. 24-54-40]|jgi:tetratricopeptide (TPR) repeat protein|nr:MAG: hypothetical protein B7X12_08460 [Halothiobacillus sp. 20-53-49]OYY41488.1 MAG: hypothetical protein B7Y58_02785 [Halothiobacillus sp. 35-54-62]OYZ87704.1 MAG: hypothetical protein B7Y07_03240 [Halothiobacillus sp. 24-54-40]OZA81486.1 MAG: hypothetical protein B7X64_01195 [Halothiobacillus sp. 39-53-45]HQS02814.1 hypothetical protein [Halothiobacillus sp.]